MIIIKIATSLYRIKQSLDGIKSTILIFTEDKSLINSQLFEKYFLSKIIIAISPL